MRQPLFSIATTAFLPAIFLALALPLHAGSSKEAPPAARDERSVLAIAGTLTFYGVKPDGDRDGIIDEVDKCPHTFYGLTVDARGCSDRDGDGVESESDVCPDTPEGGTVDSRGCLLDADADGVADYLDQSPFTPSGVLVDSRGIPLDSDADGVVDYRDKSPNTPRGVPVDAAGTPLDIDADGVADYQDRDWDTPKGAKVDAFGSVMDSDQDGIPDHADSCPNTPAKAPINREGCLDLPIITFASGRSELVEEHHPVLDRMAAVMKQSGLSVELRGHDDLITNPDQAPALSLRRARAVADYLIWRGVSPNQLILRGQGQSAPLVVKGKDEAQAANRRVELIPMAAR
ncbi:MAG: OmpA family protein [Magnetococcales bacterium]|nr:OmpA family protein [Magnetococcales bacterium]